jgi:hypothetical protein
LPALLSRTTNEAADWLSRVFGLELSRNPRFGVGDYPLAVFK